jgi:hypothetical protein
MNIKVFGRSMIVVVTALSLMDLFMTMYLLNTTTFVELNPLWAWYINHSFEEVMVALKLYFTILFAFVFWKLGDHRLKTLTFLLIVYMIVNMIHLQILYGS